MKSAKGERGLREDPETKDPVYGVLPTRPPGHSTTLDTGAGPADVVSLRPLCPPVHPLFGPSLCVRPKHVQSEPRPLLYGKLK